jgi:alpha-glucosidase
VLLLTLRGTTFLYQGEELGLPDTPVPAALATDRNGRDPQRTPLPWRPPSKAGPGAGFTAGTPWLPIGPTAETLNVSSEGNDDASTLNLYRRLIQLRKMRPSLTRGAEDLSLVHDHVLAFTRHTADETTLVLLNFSTNAVTVDLTQFPRVPESGLTAAVSTHTAGAGTGRLLGAVRLAGLEGVVLTQAVT